MRNERLYVVDSTTAITFFELFSNAVWHAKHYLQATAFLRLSGIGSWYSSQLIAQSPL